MKTTYKVVRGNPDHDSPFSPDCLPWPWGVVWREEETWPDGRLRFRHGLVSACTTQEAAEAAQRLLGT